MSDQPKSPITSIKETLTPRFKELGITKLTVHYDGHGDEGALRNIEIEPAAVSLPGELEDSLREAVEDLLASQHGCWGDGEGSTGTVVVDVPSAKITNEHGWYVSDVEYTTTEF